MQLRIRKNIFRKIQEAAVKFILLFTWRGNTHMHPTITEELRKRFVEDYFVIATRRKNSFAAFFISLSHFLMTGNWGHYTHVLMNLEDEVEKDTDFRFIEATTTGTKYSTFFEIVDDIDSIALLKPKGITLTEWTQMMDSMKIHLGKKYDNLFDLKNSAEINCVELIRLALMVLPDYHKRFAEFEKLVETKTSITPHMFLECSDFEIVYEVRI